MKSEKGKTLGMIIGAILIAVLLLCTAGLMYMICVVYDTGPLPADGKVLEWCLKLRSGFLNPAVKIITHIGDPASIVALCAVLLILPNRKTTGLPVSIGAACGLVIYRPLKYFISRARPDEIFHLVEQSGYSFPSGHAVISVIVFGLLFYLLRKHYRGAGWAKVLSFVCLALAVIIGPSRLYVGVHWLSDVLTGWCIGGIVLIMAIMILERTGRKNERIC